MNNIKNKLKISLDYIKTFLKWSVVSVIVGIVGGLIGSAFHISVDYVTELRVEHAWIIYLLPVGGILIAWLYYLARRGGVIDTNRVLRAVRKDEKVPLVMAPLIFVSTVITHLLGGSAGREGAALQLGGSIGYNVGKAFRFKESNMHIIVMAGMSSVFSALFGTPLTAAIFSLEVIRVGVFKHAGLLPCVFASLTAFMVSSLLGIPPVHFDGVLFGDLSFVVLAKVVILALLCALVSIIFCKSIKNCEHYSEKFIKNKYLRGFVGGGIIVLLTVALKTYDYNGAGMDVIGRAISGEARGEAFVLKIIFTAITIAAGFKGGEIVPTFFIGSTFGCFAGSLLGLDPGFGAALGFVALFCGVVNCPLASIILSVEVFGTEGLLFFAVVCAVSYMMSGYTGLYKSQKIMYSKLSSEYVDKHTD